MKATVSTLAHRIELGRHIVADPKICGGQPTYKGTRIMVWIVLEQLERGMTWTEVMGEWDGKVSEEAIAESIAIAELVVKHEPFRGATLAFRGWCGVQGRGAEKGYGKGGGRGVQFCVALVSTTCGKRCSQRSLRQ